MPPRKFRPGRDPGRPRRAAGRGAVDAGSTLASLQNPSPTGDTGVQPAATVVPRCRHEGVCGSCGWQHIAYDEQRRLKQLVVQRHLENVLLSDAPCVLPTLAPGGRSDVGAPTPWGYRHKVHFVCTPGANGESLVLGHFARGGQTVVPVVECPVHAESGNRLAWIIEDACQRAGIPAASADGRRGLLRHVVVRVGRGSGELLVTLVVTDGRDRRLRRLTAVLEDGPIKPAGLHVNVLEGPSPWLFGPETVKVHGRAWLREEVAGVSFLVGPTSFFQTNIEAAETLVRLVLDNVPVDAHDVLDLYAGVGLFALPLALRGHRVTAVEEHAGAVEAGRRSQTLNGIEPRRCRFVRARVEDALDRLATKGADALVLDPPRAGCSPGVLRRISARIQPKVIVYVSCDPAALARDLATLLVRSPRLEARYEVTCVQPVDMFPHTSHVETVAVLKRVSADEGDVLLPRPRIRRRVRSAREGRAA